MTMYNRLLENGEIQEEEIGEIVLNYQGEVYWNIINFFSLPKNRGFKSSSFLFMDKEWCLLLFPDSDADGDGLWIGLRSVHPKSNNTIKFRLGFKANDESEVSRTHEHQFKNTKDIAYTYFDVVWEIPYLKKRLATGRTITIFCNFLCSCSNSETSQNKPSKGTSVHTEAKLADFIKENDDTKFTSKIGIYSLIQNFKDLLLGEEEYDLLVRIKDEEFKVHKAILGARSKVFSSMFPHDTLEKRTDTVELTDCEPGTFNKFLMYIYTGQVENVPGDQVIDLYRIADKYNVEELKEECVNFMKDHMTVDTFCDVMSLGLSHNEMALIDSATKYFAENVMKIIVTDTWITFAEENPVESNKLHIKAHELKYALKRKHAYYRPR